MASAAIFLKKRIARIYAPFIIPFIVVLLLFLITGKGSEYHRDGVNIVKNIFLVQLPSQSIHPYSWSLVYEMYYYLTFCLLVIILRINVILYVAIMVLPYLVSSQYFGVIGSGDTVPLSYLNMFFCVGAIIGAYFEKIKVEFGAISVIFALAFFFYSPFISMSGNALLISSIVLFFVYSRSNISLGFFNGIGNASYSIYLIHAIVLMILKTLIDDRSVFMFIGLVSSSIGLGYIYYIFVEKYSIRWSYRVFGLQVRQ